MTKTRHQTDYLTMAVNWLHWWGNEAIELYEETQRLLKKPPVYPKKGMWMATIGEWGYTTDNLSSAVGIGLSPLEGIDDQGDIFLSPVVSGYIKALLLQTGSVADPIDNYWDIYYEEE